MKRRGVMAILALSMLLGACGTEGRTETERREPVERETPEERERGNGGQEENEVVTPLNLSSGVTSYTEGTETLTLSDEQITEEQIGALSHSSVSMFTECVQDAEAGENVLVSPTSILMAFGMTENGAENETLSQMESVIGGGITIDEMNPLLYSMANRFESSEEVQWNVANSIWFKEDGRLRVKEDFAAKASSFYGADIWGAPFDDSTVEDINNWVNHETRGMIPSVIDKLSPDARMFLINAIAFEGEWQEAYEEGQISENMLFTNADGSQSNVTMLNSQEAGYFTLGQGTGFVRPYKGGEYSFVGILPDEGLSATEYVATLAEGGEEFAEAVRNLNYDRDVYVHMPEFSLDYEKEMSELLRDMGMENAFDPELAEFGAMMEPTNPSEDWDIWISRVIHKTHIEVDREGTRAAAVTAVEIEACCSAAVEYTEPVVITLDRPFVYAIVDNATGLPVFLGCQNTME